MLFGFCFQAPDTYNTDMSTTRFWEIDVLLNLCKFSQIARFCFVKFHNVGMPCDRDKWLYTDAFSKKKAEKPAFTYM